MRRERRVPSTASPRRPDAATATTAITTSESVQLVRASAASLFEIQPFRIRGDRLPTSRSGSQRDLGRGTRDGSDAYAPATDLAGGNIVPCGPDDVFAGQIVGASPHANEPGRIRDAGAGEEPDPLSSRNRFQVSPGLPPVSRNRTTSVPAPSAVARSRQLLGPPTHTPCRATPAAGAPAAAGAKHEQAIAMATADVDARLSMARASTLLMPNSLGSRRRGGNGTSVAGPSASSRSSPRNNPFRSAHSAACVRSATPRVWKMWVR